MTDDTNTDPKPGATPRPRKPRAQKQKENDPPTPARQATIAPPKKEINADVLKDTIPFSAFYDKKPTFEVFVADAKRIVDNYSVEGITPAFSRRIERAHRSAQTARSHLRREIQKSAAGVVRKPTAVASIENQTIWNEKNILALQEKLEAALARRETLKLEQARVEAEHADDLAYRQSELTRGVEDARIMAEHSLNDLWDVCEEIIKRREDWETKMHLAGVTFENWKTGRPSRERRSSEYDSED